MVIFGGALCFFYKVAEEGPRQHLQGNVFYDSRNDGPYGLLGRSVTGVFIFITKAPIAKEAILGQTTPNSRNDGLSTEQLHRCFDVY